MKTVYINRVSDAPMPDTMPVIKTVEYPWSDDSYRPLMYARCAYREGRGLFVDLMCFQREPELSGRLLDSSCGAVSLCRAGCPDVVTAVSDCVGRCEVFVNGEPREDISGGCEFYSGDDEQGWYHGVRFYLSPGLVFGEARPGGEAPLALNFFKFKLAGERAHLGSAFPMKNRYIFSRDNLCPAETVDF